MQVRTQTGKISDNFRVYVNICKQYACSGVHSPCRQENGHKVDIYVHATAQVVVNVKWLPIIFEY